MRHWLLITNSLLLLKEFINVIEDIKSERLTENRVNNGHNKVEIMMLRECLIINVVGDQKYT